MIRKNIKCAYCGSHNFDVEVTIIPQGIDLVCNRCGRVTPIAVYSGNHTNVHIINNEKMTELYEQSYTGEITAQMIKERTSQ